MLITASLHYYDKEILMTVQNSAGGLKSHVADALTRFRYVVSPLVLLPLLLWGHWGWALVVAWLLILSDALDGVAARRWGHAPKRNSHVPAMTAKQLHAFDNTADGVMSVCLAGGIFGRLWMATACDWWDGIFSLTQIFSFAAVAVVMTPLFIWLTNSFKNGPYFDVAHGIYFGLLLAFCLFLMTGFATVDDPTLWNWLFWSQFVVFAVFVIAKGERIFSPRWGEAEYNGTLTFKGLFYR